jgi:hypothetical protein
VGREAEKSVLAARLHELWVSGKGGCVIVYGEAGAGKSTLVDTVSSTADRLGLCRINSGGQSSNDDAYGGWKVRLLIRLLGY